MRRRFFVDKFEAGRALLRGQAAEHLGRVLRAEPGQLYELSDGAAVWLARVANTSRVRNNQQIEFTLVENLSVSKSALQIRLLLSIVKFERMEWCLEKATELAVTEIVQVAASRSEKALVLAAPKRSQRWSKILIASAQQSRRLRPPLLTPLVKTPDAFAAANENLRLLLSERTDAPPLRDVLCGQSPQSVCLAIGPEGGWTEGEFDAAAKNGFHEASLGCEILRTETAVIAALAILRYALDSVAPTGSIQSANAR